MSYTPDVRVRAVRTGSGREHAPARAAMLPACVAPRKAEAS